MQHFIVRTGNIYANMLTACKQVIADPNKPTEVIIQPYVEKRNTDQNAFFHALMRDLSKQYAETYGEVVAPDVWKEYLKRKFLGQESIPMRNGETFAYTRHTSKLNKAEMAEFIDKCIMWCADELKIVIDEAR